MTPRLFHVSETFGIARFAPRPVPSPDAGVTGEAVWAVAESHLPNYLLPRDCPRIAFRRGPATTTADGDAFLLGARHVVAFEADWLDRVRAASLAVYQMPPDAFAEALPEAGYWISRDTVTPVEMRRIDDVLGELVRVGVDVRIVRDFWRLRDAVVASSLEFSIIRARNAGPRAEEARKAGA